MQRLEDTCKVILVWTCALVRSGALKLACFLRCGVTPRFPNNVNNTNNQSIQRKTGYHTTFKFINRVKFLFIKTTLSKMHLTSQRKIISKSTTGSTIFGTTTST